MELKFLYVKMRLKQKIELWIEIFEEVIQKWQIIIKWSRDFKTKGWFFWKCEKLHFYLIGDPEINWLKPWIFIFKNMRSDKDKF